MNTEKETMNEEIINKGVTEDYIWYEARILRDNLNSLVDGVAQFVQVVAARDKDNRAVIAKLYAENFQMNQEIKDLKEKSNESSN
jgi:cell division protein FtsB